MVNAKQLQKIMDKISTDLPAETGYKKGFKDALQSISMALVQTLNEIALKEAVLTVLDAYGNNYDEAYDEVTLNLNVYDDVGNVVDGTTANLSVDQLSDIVDQASQLILIRRDGQNLDGWLNDLEEALSAADVIDPVEENEAHRGN